MEQGIVYHGNADDFAAHRPVARIVRSLLTAVAASGAMVAAAQAPATGEDVSLPSFVRFNIVCLKCHEAQCSGRLSLDSAAGSAKSHVLRYTGRLMDTEVEELFIMLKYMKEQCGYYPMLGLPGGGRWTADEAARLRGEDERSYFVPLGTLAAHDYSLRLRFESDTSGSVRITSAAFDEVVNDVVRTQQGRAVVRVRPPLAAAHYLYLTLDGPARLLELELAESADGAP
jgi:hypothetical protein